MGPPLTRQAILARVRRLPAAAVAAGTVALVLSLAVVFSAPAHIVSDSENFVVYFRLLAAGGTVPIHALSVPHPIPALATWLAYETLGGPRAVQFLCALVFAVFCGAVYDMIRRLAGHPGAVLGLWGILTSQRVIGYVTWGRSPVWGMMFVGLGLAWLAAAAERNRPENKCAAERHSHGLLAFSALATLSRTDFVFSHILLCCFFSARLWRLGARRAATRVACWLTFAFTPFVNDYLFSRDPLWTLHGARHWKAIEQALHGNTSSAFRPPAGMLAGTRAFLHRIGNALDRGSSILSPIWIAAWWLGAVRLYRKNRVLFGAVTALLAASVLCWPVYFANGFVVERVFAIPRVVLFALSGVGLGWLASFLPNPRWRCTALFALALGLTCAHLHAYRLALDHLRKCGRWYQKHARFAQAIQKAGLREQAPFVSQDAAADYIYMTRLRLFHDDVPNERHIRYLRQTGKPLPPYRSYIRSRPDTPFPEFADMMPGRVLLEEDGIALHAAHPPIPPKVP